MNRNSDSQERSKWDFMHFGIMFGGFLVSIAGISTLSAGIAVTGAVLMAYGLCYFALQRWLRGDAE